MIANAGFMDPAFDEIGAPGSSLGVASASACGGSGTVNHMISLMSQGASGPTGSQLNYNIIDNSALAELSFLGKINGEITMDRSAPFAEDASVSAMLAGMNTTGGPSSSAASAATGISPMLPDFTFPNSTVARGSMTTSDSRTMAPSLQGLKGPPRSSNDNLLSSSNLFGDLTSSGTQNATSVKATAGLASGKTPCTAPSVLKPLSAYNYFFTEERDRILNGGEKSDDVTDGERQRRLLASHLSKDRNKRRPHRKTHGKISFTTLSKRIGQKWRQLDANEKEFYEHVAKADLDRYKAEMATRVNGK